MGQMIGDLASAGVADPAVDARILLCAATEIDHTELIRNPDEPLDGAACDRLSLMLARRVRREPISRILGRRGFWSLDLIVTPDVLDPRPESETLIDAALEHFADRQLDSLKILDLGTGSGALVCALLDVFPRAFGVAIDVSPQACVVARRNLTQCGFKGRFSIVEGDWSSLPTEAFDLIVSNPPYIKSGEIAGLDPEVCNFDPLIALDGGVDGLDAYRQIAPVITKCMPPSGVAVLEVGADQGNLVANVFATCALECVGIRRDYAGRDRAVLIVPESQNQAY